MRKGEKKPSEGEMRWSEFTALLDPKRKKQFDWLTERAYELDQAEHCVEGMRLWIAAGDLLREFLEEKGFREERTDEILWSDVFSNHETEETACG